MIILHIAVQGNGREGVIFRATPAKLLTAENAEFAEDLFSKSFSACSVISRPRKPPYFCLAII